MGLDRITLWLLEIEADRGLDNYSNTGEYKMLLHILIEATSLGEQDDQD